MRNPVAIALLIPLLIAPAIAAEKGLETKITVDFVDTALTDALSYFSAVTNVHAIVDPEVDAEKLEITMKLDDIPLRSALTHLLKAVGLSWDERWGGVFVAKRARLAVLPKDPLPLPAESEESEENAKLRKRLAGLKVTFDFQEAPLKDCLSYVSFLHSVNAVTDDSLHGRIRSTTFTGKVSDVAFGDALALILVPRGLTAEIHEGVVFIRKGGPKKTPSKREPKKDVPKVLEETRLMANFEGTDLREVLIWLGKRTGYPFHVDPEVYRTTPAKKLTVTLATKVEVPARGLLDLVTITKSLDWDIRWGGVFVATKERLASLPKVLLPKAAAAEAKDWEVALRKLLAEKKLSFDYEDVGLITTLSRIRDRGGVNILIEPKAAKAMAEMTVDLRINRQPLSEILTVILVPRGFTFELRHEVVVVR
jgi:hypothetical protein